MSLYGFEFTLFFKYQCFCDWLPSLGLFLMKKKIHKVHFIYLGAQNIGSQPLSRQLALLYSRAIVYSIDVFRDNRCQNSRTQRHQCGSFWTWAGAFDHTVPRAWEQNLSLLFISVCTCVFDTMSSCETVPTGTLLADSLTPIMFHLQNLIRFHPLPSVRRSSTVASSETESHTGQNNSIGYRPQLRVGELQTLDWLKQIRRRRVEFSKLPVQMSKTKTKTKVMSPNMSGLAVGINVRTWLRKQRVDAEKCLSK